MSLLKNVISGLLVLIAMSCHGQQYTITAVDAPGINIVANDKAEMADRGQPPKDLWRSVDGETCCICGPGFDDYYRTTFPRQWEGHGKRSILAAGWYIAVGKVIEVQPLGIRVRGYCTYFFKDDRAEWGFCFVSHYNFFEGDPYLSYGYRNPEQMTFFIVNYPYPIGENERITLCAVKDADVHTYNTVSGGSASIHRFDYGMVASRPSAPPPTPEDVQAAKLAAKVKKAESEAKNLQYDREKADSGDSDGQRHMGERFRDGDGVKRSIEAAKIWLCMAAAQGDKKAASELADLPLK